MAYLLVARPFPCSLITAPITLLKFVQPLGLTTLVVETLKPFVVVVVPYLVLPFITIIPRMFLVSSPSVVLRTWGLPFLAKMTAPGPVPSRVISGVNTLVTADHS